MQGINPPTSVQLLQAGQQPLMKVEIYVGAAWINLNSLAGEIYVESASISLGGASMTPNPVAGKWNVSLFNQDGIFHPDHPTSAYVDYLKTERLTRISVGATYGGVDYYWQRIIGFMNIPRFTAPDYRISISGGDYMKCLRETELRLPNNYWGSSQLYNSIASDGTAGVELYTAVDAVDPADDGTAPYNNLADWNVTRCLFVPHADGGVYVGKYNSITSFSFTKNPTAFNVVAGTEYRCTFRAKRIVGGAGAGVHIAQFIGGAWVPFFVYVAIDSDEWKDYAFYFTAMANGPVRFLFHVITAGEEYWIDNISVFNFIPYWERYYELPGPATGPYYVTVDIGAGPVPCWQGEGDDDWKYDADAEAGPDPPAHPAKILYFNLNKLVLEGVNKINIYYFEQQVPENVIADLLVLAKVPDPTTNLPYVNRAAVLARMQFDATGKTIDMVWFNAGTKCLNAIKMICEFCDYRFYFRHDGVPFFKPKPTWVGADFIFTDPKHIASISTYQSTREIKNRIVIKGLKQSDTPGQEQTMPSDLVGEDSDAGSITAYGERTLTITNHLFQTQASIDAMCTALLAEYKDPKWYSDLSIPFNPIPLELGDNIQWEERLSPTLNITQTGIIRDIKIDGFTTVYKCEHA